MKRDRTPTFWTSDPPGLLPAGQGDLPFAPSCAHPEDERYLTPEYRGLGYEPRTVEVCRACGQTLREMPR